MQEDKKDYGLEESRPNQDCSKDLEDFEHNMEEILLYWGHQLVAVLKEDRCQLGYFGCWLSSVSCFGLNATDLLLRRSGLWTIQY
jgi:hypothetical protein